jgi:hypothetical protein
MVSVQSAKLNKNELRRPVMPISQDRFESKQGRFYKVPNWVLQQAGRDTIADWIRGETVWLPSVSTILEIYRRPGLMEWYGAKGLEEAERIRDDTAEIGTIAHALIERINLGGKVDKPEWDTLDERVRQAVRAYLRWKMESKFHPLESELTVYSLKYGYAGTIDAVGYFSGTAGIADWKATRSWWKINNLQLAAYRQAYHETFPARPNIDELRCIRFDKDTGIPEEHRLSIPEADEAFQCFLGFLRAWRYLSNGGANG